MSSKEPRTDIYVKREHWTSGYQMVARSNGKFITNEKWHGAHSTERVLNKVRAGNITEEKSRFAYHFRGYTDNNEPRTFAIFAKRRIYLGSRKKRKHDTVPMRKTLREKYARPEYSEMLLEVRFRDVRDAEA